METSQSKKVHLVYTRFNLAIKFGGEGKNDGLRKDSSKPQERPWLDEDYLEERFRIFEKYTFESMMHQSNKNFIWFVLFHRDTPEKYKNRIRLYEKRIQQFCPRFFDDEECNHISQVIEKDIQEHYQGYVVITTRIDNDDLVSEDFVEEIQKDAVNNGNDIYFLSYTNGLQYDMRSKQITGFTYPNNHFISLITEPRRVGEHILKFNHAYIDESGIGIVHKKTKMPLWIEVIHASNVSNLPHWRFKDICVPYQVREKYESLELQWDSKVGYFVSILKGVCLVFWNRGKGLCDIIRTQILRNKRERK